MARQPARLEDIALTGNKSNLNRAIKRQAVPLSAEDRCILSALDDLVLTCIKAAKCGSTRRGKANPAFRQLEIVMKLRKSIGGNRGAAEKTGAEILAEASKFLEN